MLKHFFYIISAAAILFVLAIMFPIFLLRATVNENCENLLRIAKNEEKMSYLITWIEENARNRILLEQMGVSGVMRSRSSGIEFIELGVDWDYLGIDEQYARVNFYRYPWTATNYKDYSAIQSIAFGEGRNEIIVNVNDLKVNGVPNLEGDNKKMVYIDERVSVYCD